MQGGPRIKHLDDLPWMEVSRIQLADGQVASIFEKWIELSPRLVTYYNKWDPGAMVPNHGHHGDHVVFVLEGEMSCGDLVCRAGSHITLEYGDTFGPWIAGPEGVVMFGAMFGGFGHPFQGDEDGWHQLLAERDAKELPVPPVPVPPWMPKGPIITNPEEEGS